MPTSSPIPSRELAIRLPAPHPGQQIVRQQARRFNFLCAGRRWRKTTLAVSIMVEAALYGGEYGWFAPVHKQVRIGWDEMRRACGNAVEWNESRLEARFPGGGIVRFASLEIPDNVRGWTLDGFEMDEASEITARAWYEILRPMLLDTNGWGWFTFTPKGQNWVWQEWLLARQAYESGDGTYEGMAWQTPTLGCVVEDERLVRRPHPLENPHIDFESLCGDFARMPERTFRQEILAEFLDDAGGVFRGVEACLGGSLEERPPHRMQQYVIGIDLAKHADYTVLVVADVAERRVVAFDRFNKADWGLQKARIVATAQHWNNAICWMDATGIGDPIYDDLRRAGLRIHPYTFSNLTKQVLIENAVLMVEQRHVRIPAGLTVLTNELKALQYSTTPAGALRIAAPEGMHDDAAMAFCLMCWPLGHAPSGRALTAEAMEQIRRPISEIGGTRIMGRTF